MKNQEIPEKYDYIKKELAKFYNDRDESHGFGHVEQVCKNALYIAHATKYIIDDANELLLVIAALGHDIWDHKYMNASINLELLKARFMTALFVCGVPSQIILKSIKIIDSVSLSLEMDLREKGKQLDLPADIIVIRNIVSDADKLESLGEICVLRMVQYGLYNNISSIEYHFNHIKHHSATKLYKLLDEYYIITDVGRRLAKPLMAELKNIVDNDDKLRQFIVNSII